MTRSPTRLLALPVAPPAWTSSSPLRNRGLCARRDGAEGRSMAHHRLGMHLGATAHEAVGIFRKEVDAGFVSLSVRQAHQSRCILTDFQTVCKVRKLVSAKGRALVVGCRDEDAVGNSLVLVPCLKPSKGADPFDGPGHAVLTAL
ncbi:hypothetical protein V8E53_007637 [Lactarius tabidus]